VAQWLRHLATNQKVMGSIPNGVIGISLVLFQCLPVTFNFSPVSSQSFGLRSLLGNLCLFGPKEAAYL
jgi:hypothetical protein